MDTMALSDGGVSSFLYPSTPLCLTTSCSAESFDYCYSVDTPTCVKSSSTPSRKDEATNAHYQTEVDVRGASVSHSFLLGQFSLNESSQIFEIAQFIIHFFSFTRSLVSDL